MKEPMVKIKRYGVASANKTNGEKIFSLVEFYRVVKKIKPEQMNYLKGRLFKAAKSILVLTDYNLNKGKKIILMAKDYYDSEGLSWTLETVVKNFNYLMNKCDEENL